MHRPAGRHGSVTMGGLCCMVPHKLRAPLYNKHVVIWSCSASPAQIFIYKRWPTHSLQP